MDMLDDAYKNGDDNEKKRKRKNVCSNVNSLKRAKKQNRHITNVMSVTHNGEKL